MRIAKLVAILGAVAAAAGPAMAQGFDGGVPATWACTGNCGAVAPNGAVAASPYGGTMMGYVSSYNGAVGAGQISGISYPADMVGTAPYLVDGSLLTSATFSASVGDPLDFYFDYVTSDGSGYPDYAWAALINTADPSDPVYLFTAATQPSGDISPGVDLPANAATLTPATSGINPGNCTASNYGHYDDGSATYTGIPCDGATWSPLGQSSSQCFEAGCGSTGWILSTFNITETGTYELEFGVTNSYDNLYDSGLAIDGLTVAGQDIVATPEPASMTLFATGLVGLIPLMRRRARQA
ncbi:MAG TPA: NF038132 family protein [Gemmatimonadaceae bacterium]|nr:NF038132 family protein [Gemmatimonadaceae bacterium]